MLLDLWHALRLSVGQLDFQMKGQWNAKHFKNDKPITLELACGRGEYTVALAEKYPESFDAAVPEDLVYSGNIKLTDSKTGVKMSPIETEEISSGHVSFSIYSLYMLACGGALILISLFFVFIIFATHITIV